DGDDSRLVDGGEPGAAACRGSVAPDTLGPRTDSGWAGLRAQRAALGAGAAGSPLRAGFKSRRGRVLPLRISYQRWQPGGMPDHRRVHRAAGMRAGRRLVTRRPRLLNWRGPGRLDGRELVRRHLDTPGGNAAHSPLWRPVLR